MIRAAFLSTIGPHVAWLFQVGWNGKRAHPPGFGEIEP